MHDLFSDKVRRNPFPMYDYMRSATPVMPAPAPFDLWMIFDYEGVKRALTDHEAFSSRVPGPPWFIFFDPPRHTKLRGLLARAFTPRVIASLEPGIRELSARLLDRSIPRGEMDLAAEYSVPLPMMVIAGMIGIPPSDWERYRRWSDGILRLSYTLRGVDDAEAAGALDAFRAVTVEMKAYLAAMIAERNRAGRPPADAPDADLLSRLLAAEVDGERLTEEEILGFFQLLVLGGQETTANLINNAILCFLENPDQLARLRGRMDLMPTAIEEVLRYRSPLQWVMRTPTRDIEMGGRTIPAGRLVLAMLGSANRDPRQFPDPGRFDITRDPNPHVAFGHGIHFCMGAALSRLEARIALTDLLQRTIGLALANDEPWEPRKALHVHGPSRLPVRFQLA